MNYIFTDNGDKAFDKLEDSNLITLFSKLGTYKKSDTPYSEVKNIIKECSKESFNETIALLLVSRAITRDVKINNDKPQKVNGKGNRDFTFKAIVALLDLNYKSIDYLVWMCSLVGRYKDIWEIALLILEHCPKKIELLYWVIEKHINSAFYELDGNAAKYLPSLVKSNRDTEFYNQKKKIVNLYLQKYNSIISKIDSAKIDDLRKELISLPLNKSYRKLKSQVGSHDFQKFISMNRPDLIEINNIPSIALANMIKNEFFEKGELKSKFEEFVNDKLKKNEYKSVREFYHVMNDILRNNTELSELELTTLINKTKEQMKEDVLVIADTSISMESSSSDPRYSCVDIAQYMAYFMSQCNTHYTNRITEFSKTANTIVVQEKGTHKVKFLKLNWKGEVANTNLLSVAKHMVQIRKEIGEYKMPKKAIVITDSEFDSSTLSFNSNMEFRNVLLKNKFSIEYVNNFKIVYWCIAKNFKLPTNTSMALNTFAMSGMDASNLGVVTGDFKNQRELYYEFINQPVIINLIKEVFN